MGEYILPLREYTKSIYCINQDKSANIQHKIACYQQRRVKSIKKPANKKGVFRVFQIFGCYKRIFLVKIKENNNKLESPIQIGQ